MIEQLVDQVRVAEDYLLFLRCAIERGFAVEVALIVDGQFSSSTIMITSRDQVGYRVLEFLSSVAQAECLRLKDRLSDLY